MRSSLFLQVTRLSIQRQRTALVLPPKKRAVMKEFSEQGNSFLTDQAMMLVKNLRFDMAWVLTPAATDGVIYDFLEQKIVVKSKSLTTKWDFSIGVNNCLEKLDTDLLQKVEFVSVSTTLATNAIVEAEGQRVGLLLMGGILQNHDDRIAHRLKSYIKEAINIRSAESEPVDPGQVRQVVRQMIEREGVGLSSFGNCPRQSHRCSPPPLSPSSLSCLDN